MVKEYIREDDGSRTTTSAIEMAGILKTHNNTGPAIVNKEQEIKEYYLYGVKLEKVVWEKQRKYS